MPAALRLVPRLLNSVINERIAARIEHQTREPLLGRGHAGRVADAE